MLVPFCSKKGDLEFIEVIMVVVVVVLLFVIGLAIYYNVFSGEVEEVGKRISEVESSVLVNVRDSLPEVQCSVRGAPKDCVDVLKLNAFKKVVDSNKAYYSSSFGFKVIRFEQVYPVYGGAVGTGECTSSAFQSSNYPYSCANWTVYSNPKPNYISKNIVKTPVSLFHSTANSYAVGILFVEVYS